MPSNPAAKEKPMPIHFASSKKKISSLKKAKKFRQMNFKIAMRRYNIYVY